MAILHCRSWAITAARAGHLLSALGVPITSRRSKNWLSPKPFNVQSLVAGMWLEESSSPRSSVESLPKTGPFVQLPDNADAPMLLDLHGSDPPFETPPGNRCSSEYDVDPAFR